MVSTATLKILVSGITWWDVAEAFLLRSDPVLEEMDRASSGVKQKNSSSADEDSPNFADADPPLRLLMLLLRC